MGPISSLFRGPISLLFEDPGAFLLLAIPLLYSIIIHEVAHGWVADKMGDSTARWMGRLTLDPRRHFDPVGTTMLFLFGFGWAKPVPVNFDNLRPVRRGLIFVSAAGITANVLLALIAELIFHFFRPTGPLFLVLREMFNINIILASFNLIPIPPLDGSKILMGFSTRRFQYSLSRLEPYGFFIIIALLWTGILNPVIGFFAQVISGLIGLLIP
jgi:Zn-dependent protease